MSDASPALRAVPLPVLPGLALVPLGDDDAGACVDGVCAVPASEPHPPRG
ncbi:hypothetical protein [Cellulomonas sp. NS3]|nr:hypothetical protein [Cellulomonas sp. NS3]